MPSGVPLSRPAFVSVPVFVYGTLQFPQIMAAVTGGRFVGVPARLDGYARYCLRDVPYPGIAPVPDGQVDGVLYPDIDPSLLACLDAFEGEAYQREAVTVHDRDGRPRAAETYVIRPAWRSLLIDAPWDPDAFAERWHDAYVRACRAGEEPP